MSIKGHNVKKQKVVEDIQVFEVWDDPMTSSLSKQIAYNISLWLISFKNGRLWETAEKFLIGNTYFLPV